MHSKFQKIFFFCGSALLLSLSPSLLLAQDPGNTQPAANTGLGWRISCHGVANIPMTADPEQTLPLQIVATLKCGEEVTPLSDLDGYTVRVRTADGNTGYVTSVNVKKGRPARQPVELGSASLKNGVAHWHEGAPGCDQFMSDGTLVESLTVDGITVQVSLHDTGWKIRANVAIANASTHAVEIEPHEFILDNVGPHGKPLFYQDPAELAKNVTHQALWTESNATPTIQARSESASSANATLTLSYRTSDSRASAPNYLVQHQMAQDDAIRDQGRQTLVNTAQQIQQLALKAGAVQPNDKKSGAVWFERDKNLQRLVLRVPVEGVTFEFPLSFKQK
jgi:hypothetical protein